MMATQDKVLLMHRVEETLKPRMFANLLEEATAEINETLDDFDVKYTSTGASDGTDDMLRTYIEAKRTEDRSEKTLVRYQYLIERFMAFAKVKTRDVTTYHVRDYFIKEQERGVSDNTIEGIRGVLNAYFGWLEHEKMIERNPVFNIAPLHVQKVVREEFSDTDIEKMKRCCKDIRDMAIIHFLLSTGCRISEVVALNRDDIDFHECECTVLGKGKKERIVYIDSVAHMILREYFESRRDSSPALFVGRYGKRIDAGGIRAMLKRIEKKSGVKDVHPHRFRRTMITKLLNRGMPIQEVAVVAGHDKLDTTMQYYASNNKKIKNSYQRYTT